MTDSWSATRIASVLHRSILAPLGFERSGTTCARTDHQLVRTITFHATPFSMTPQVQPLLSVALDGLPAPLGPYRRDALWGHVERHDSPPRHNYPRPPRADPLPESLIADVSGPAVEFLTHARDLDGFIAWAEQVYAGDEYRGWWRRVQPVKPQGSGPLQAATYAAVLAGDDATADRLAAQVAAGERDADELDRFHAELAHVRTALSRQR